MFNLGKAGGFRCYVACISFLATFSLLAYLRWLVTMATFPFELDYGEGIVLWQSQHVIHLATAYGSITHYPFVVFEYPPLYPLVSWATSKFIGNLLLAGRCVSLVSTIALCLTLAWIVYRSVPSRAPRIAAVGGAFFAGALPCGLDAMSWAPLMRVDMLGLLLTFLGLAVFILSQTEAKRYLAFVLFVAAMYTRQTMIAGALSCLLIAALMNRRQALKMLFFTAVLGSVVMAVLLRATHGEVIKHLFLYNQNPFSIRQAVSFLSANVQSILAPLALALAAAIGTALGFAAPLKRRSLSKVGVQLSSSRYRRAVMTMTVYLFLSGLISLSAGKEGSNVNYFLEWNLAVCVLAGLFLARVLCSWPKARLSYATALAYSLPLLIMTQQAVAATRFAVSSSSARAEFAARARDSQALLDILKKSPEPIMSEDMTLLYKAGKQLPFEPQIVAFLAREGVWDESPLISMIRKHAFSVMVIRDLHSVRYSPAVAQAITENYNPTQTYGRFTVYVPAH